MTDDQAPDRLAEHEEQQHHSEHINEMLGRDSDEEFVFAEKGKPINRNAVVLLLIALVGASMIYLMYLRGRFNADQQTMDADAIQKVGGFMGQADGNFAKLKDQIDKTEAIVKAIQAKPGEGQVPGDQLKSNPFGFEDTPKAANVQTGPAVVASDPAAVTARALAKVDVQMILYGANSSVQINNYLYKAGDTLTVETVSFTIQSIARDSVVLKNSQGQWTVRPLGTKPL